MSNWRDDHRLLHIWSSKHQTFVECACGWCSPHSVTDENPLTWWEYHVRQMRVRANDPLREAFRSVLALHGRVALDELENTLDELVVAAAQLAAADSALSVSTRVTETPQNASWGPLRG